jgi:hypothetical protein
LPQAEDREAETHNPSMYRGGAGLAGARGGRSG